MVEEPEYFINKLQLIISVPAMFVPSLSDESIRVSILEVITGYFEGNLSFEILLSIMDSLALFKGMRERTQLNVAISDVLFKINELSQYKNLENDKETINDILLKALDRLTK